MHLATLAQSVIDMCTLTMATMKSGGFNMVKKMGHIGINLRAPGSMQAATAEQLAC